MVCAAVRIDQRCADLGEGSRPGSQTRPYHSPVAEQPAAYAKTANPLSTRELAEARERTRRSMFQSAPRRVGRYTVLGKVGEGGMGVVFAAHDPELDRRVALKLLTAERAGHGPEPKQRLLAEARAMARVAHPNVVAVFEAGLHEPEIGEASVFVAMEFVEGQTLRDWVDETRPKWTRTLEVYREAGRGLAAVHDAGLVHRDFKPDNAMIDESGRVFVMDFGLARDTGFEAPAIDSPSAAATLIGKLTRTGALLGTPAYMAPEQFAGNVADARSDQYSFCVALYEALWRRRPYDANTPVALAATLIDEEPPKIPPPDDVPRGVRAAILRGLAPNPDLRWPTMDMLVAELSPRRRSRRILVGVTGIATAVVATSYAAISGPETSACAGAEEAIAETWNPKRAEEVVRAFDRAAPTWGATAAQHATSLVDAYAERWANEHASACRSALDDESTGDALLDARMRCLTRRQGELASVIDALATADAGVVIHYERALEGLVEPERCTEPAYLEVTDDAPDDPRVARRVQELEQRLAAIHTTRVLGAPQRALQQLEAMAADVAALDHAPLSVAVQIERARLLAELEPGQAAFDALERAYFGAVTARRDLEAVRVALDLAGLLASSLHDLDAAQHWLELGQEGAERAGLTDGQVDLAAAAAEVARASGRVGEAIELQVASMRRIERECPRPCGRAVQRYIELSNLENEAERIDDALAYADLAVQAVEATRGRDAPAMARALMRRAESLVDLDRPADAIAPLRRVIELRTRDKGEGHLDTLGAQAVLGSALLRAGETEDGLALLERTADKAREVEFPAFAGAVLNRLGGEYVDLDRTGDARRVYLAARDLAQETLPPEHPAFAILESNLAHVEQTEGNHAEALVRFQQALKMRRNAAQEQDASVVRFLYNLARSYELVGQPAEAIPYLDEATGLLEGQSLRKLVVDVAVAQARTMRLAGSAGAEQARTAILARCTAADETTRERSGCDTAETRIDRDPQPDPPEEPPEED